MKNILFVAAMALTFAYPTYAADDGPGKGEIKKVCHDKTDKNGKVINGKDGKPLQECKDVKVRKKLEGTEIPPKK
jgi:hypothetical protein